MTPQNWHDRRQPQQVHPTEHQKQVLTLLVPSLHCRLDFDTIGKLVLLTLLLLKAWCLNDSSQPAKDKKHRTCFLAWLGF